MKIYQLYYCDKCGYASENRFEIEYHESLPDPPSLPVKVGDQIWVETWISDEMEKRGETESPVLRTITAIKDTLCPYGYGHQWEIHLDVPIMREDSLEGFHYETSSIVGVVFTTTNKEVVDMNDYAIRTSGRYKFAQQMSVNFYKDFTG